MQTFHLVQEIRTLCSSPDTAAGHNMPTCHMVNRLSLPARQRTCSQSSIISHQGDHMVRDWTKTSSAEHFLEMCVCQCGFNSFSTEFLRLQPHFRSVSFWSHACAHMVHIFLHLYTLSSLQIGFQPFDYRPHLIALINISLYKSWSGEACWLVVSQAAVVGRNDSGAIKPTATDVNVVQKEKRKHSRQTRASWDVGHSSAAAGERSTHSRCSSRGSHSGSERHWKHVWSFLNTAAASLWDDISCLSRLRVNLPSRRLITHHDYKHKPVRDKCVNFIHMAVLKKKKILELEKVLSRCADHSVCQSDPRYWQSEVSSSYFWQQ